MLLKRLELTGSFILDYIAHYPMLYRSRLREVDATPQAASAQENFEAQRSPDADRPEPGQPQKTKRVSQRTTEPPSRSKRT
jgi:hypothetical protein